MLCYLFLAAAATFTVVQSIAVFVDTLFRVVYHSQHLPSRTNILSSSASLELQMQAIPAAMQ